ncbi:hypothetical protein EV424DRAFT_1429228 [Suillus variegatus]|nr:hypothetical protein EV424DRAFT_1429228 [Suillus variegatus]
MSRLVFLAVLAALHERRVTPRAVSILLVNDDDDGLFLNVRNSTSVQSSAIRTSKCYFSSRLVEYYLPSSRSYGSGSMTSTYLYIQGELQVAAGRLQGYRRAAIGRSMHLFGAYLVHHDCTSRFKSIVTDYDLYICASLLYSILIPTVCYAMLRSSCSYGTPIVRHQPFEPDRLAAAVLPVYPS